MKDQQIVLMIVLVNQKKVSINFTTSKSEFCLSLDYIDDERYRSMLTKQEFVNLKVLPIHSYQFWLGSVFKDFANDEMKKNCIKW